MNTNVYVQNRKIIKNQIIYEVENRYFELELSEENRIQYQCCEVTGKRCYSQKEAGRIANKYSKGHQKKHYHNVPVRSYFCKDCRHFHLTHKYYGEYEKAKDFTDVLL